MVADYGRGVATGIYWHLYLHSSGHTHHHALQRQHKPDVEVKRNKRMEMVKQKEAKRLDRSREVEKREYLAQPAHAVLGLNRSRTLRALVCR
jgi:hypothetical protein